MYEPANVDVLANMGFIYFQRENFRRPLNIICRPINSSDHAGLLAALGLSFARGGHLAQAITAFQQSLNSIPRTDHALEFRPGLLLFKKLDQAMEQWRIVSQLDSGYASRREEEQYRVYDNSLVEILPRLEKRTILMSPPLPRPHTRLLPGYNARTYRPIINDAELQKVAAMKTELNFQARSIASMSAK